MQRYTINIQDRMDRQNKASHTHEIVRVHVTEKIKTIKKTSLPTAPTYRTLLEDLTLLVIKSYTRRVCLCMSNYCS